MKLRKVWRPKKSVLVLVADTLHFRFPLVCGEVVSLYSEDTTLGAFRYRGFWETEYVRWFICHRVSGCFSRIGV